MEEPVKFSDPWQIDAANFPLAGEPEDRLKFLLRYAILAPSVHNTQPWVFSIEPDRIHVFVDRSCWLRAADTDQRDLHVSLGCAIGNLLIAGRHFGYRCTVEYYPTQTNPTLAAIVKLEAPASPIIPPAETDPLFDAITRRSTDHRIFSSEPVGPNVTERLAACCNGEGLSLYTSRDLEMKRSVDELAVHADAVQFTDAAYRAELARWIAQGVFDEDWLLTKLAQLAASHLRHESHELKAEYLILKSAPIVGILASKDDKRATQLRAGRAFERVFLTAVSMGVRIEPMTHVLQVPETKEAIAALPPIQGLYPQVVFRLGHAESEPRHTTRRPLEQVLLSSEVAAADQPLAGQSENRAPVATVSSQ